MDNYTLAFGPYSAGQIWKWSSRMEGGALILAGLFAGFGYVPNGLAIFGIVTLTALLFTHRVGLAYSPPTKQIRLPGGDWAWARILQDRLGDVVLTILWNLVRRVTPYRVGSSAGRNLA